MSLWERWKKVSINNKLMIYMTAILAVATTLYTLMYRSQVKFTEQNAKQTAEQTDRLIASSEKLAASTRAALEEAKRVNKESADRAERATKAGETQANASMSQANTSDVSARAAQESARVARQVYEAGQQPQIYFQSSKVKSALVANKKPLVQFGFGNSGKKAFAFTIERAVAIRSRDFEGTLPSNTLAFDKVQASLEQNESTQEDLEFNVMLSDDQIRAFIEGSQRLIFYGCAHYNDGFGQPHAFSFCGFYNRDLFPTLAVCPETIKAPDCKHRERKAN